MDNGQVAWEKIWGMYNLAATRVNGMPRKLNIRFFNII